MRTMKRSEMFESNTRLQNYDDPDAIEQQAKDNKLVDLQYIGPRPSLKGKRGKGYFINSENQWYFQPSGTAEFYRVNVNNLFFEK